MSSPSASSSSAPPLRWGIVSTGRIAGVFARDLPGAKLGRLVAVGSRSTESARTFAAEHGIEPAHTHGSLAALLADGEVDAVYVATPHPMHCEVVVAALAAGKHVLCEKPIAMSLAEVDAMQAAAPAHFDGGLDVSLPSADREVGGVGGQWSDRRPAPHSGNV